MCNTHVDCNNQGYCVDGECLCNVAWFGTNCQENLDHYSRKGFIAYRAVFIIAFSMLLLLSFRRLYYKVKKEKHLFGSTNWLFVIKTLRSPYNLAMLSIFLICLLRILWLSIDPFGYHLVLHRSIERVLFETIFSVLFWIYAIILWVWYSIYEELSRKNKKRSTLRHICFKIKIKLFVVIVFGAQMVTSIFKGFYDNNLRWATFAVYFILFIFLAIFTLEFAVFGWLLYRCVTDQEDKVNQYYEKVAVQKGSLAAVLSIANQPQNAQDVSIEIENSPERDGRSKRYEYETEGGSPLKRNHSPGKRERDSDTPKAFTRSPGKKKTVIFHPEPAVMSEDGSAHIPISPFSITPTIKDDHTYGSGTPSLRKLPLNKYASVPIGLVANASNGGRKQTIMTPKHKPDIENKIKGIVQRHQKHIEPVQLMGTEESNIATEISVIVDDEADISWCYNEVQEVMDYEEEQRRKELKREEARKDIAEIRQNKEVIRHMNSDKIKKKNTESSFYLKLLEDPAYLKHHQEISKHDKVIIRRILGLTVIGILLEILFALILVLVFGSASFQSPAGMIAAMWFTGILEILAIISIIVLFSIVQTQEKENLRIIMTIGQNRNRINRLYGFVLPPKLRQEESKKRLEKSINQMTVKYMSTLHSISK